MEPTPFDSVICRTAKMSMLGLPIGRTTSTIRLGHAGTLIHSPLELTNDEAAILEALPRPWYMLLPSHYHTRNYDAYIVRYPEITFFGETSVLEEFPQKPKVFYALEDLPAEVKRECDACVLAGMPAVKEIALFHRSSRSLLLADAIFNILDHRGDLGHWTLNLAGIYSRPSVSKLYRSKIKDTSAFAASLHQVLHWDFIRIFVGHGRPITEKAREVFKACFDDYLA